MALSTTTLSSAVAVTDNVIVVASATSFQIGDNIICDGEQMQVSQAYQVGSTTVNVLRGRGGTVTAAHPATANVTRGLSSDFSNPGPGNSPVNYPNVRSVVEVSYSASGAIALPSNGCDLRVILNGTSTLAMTLAAPTKDLDFSRVSIVGNGKSASHVDVTAGYGAAGSGYTVLTMQNAGQVGFELMAANGAWVVLNAPITGTSTKVSLAIS